MSFQLSQKRLVKFCSEDHLCFTLVHVTFHCYCDSSEISHKLLILESMQAMKLIHLCLSTECGDIDSDTVTLQDNEGKEHHPAGYFDFCNSGVWETKNSVEFFWTCRDNFAIKETRCRLLDIWVKRAKNSR